MSSDGSGQTARLDPVQGVLEVLDRAAMTGTNKLGLLLTLLDLAPTLDGESPCIARQEVAERYLEIHWEHARPYQGITLRQSSARKRRDDGTVADDTTVMQEIHRLRDLLQDCKRGDLRDKPLGVVERSAEGTTWHLEWAEALETALAKVRAALLKNPVRLLQELPGSPEPFLYDLHSDKSGLTLLPGVVQSLTKFGGVLRPLVEFRFAQAVMRINRETLQLPVDDVYSHLFGRDRVMPPPKMRERLVGIQGGHCIYTGDKLQDAGGSLDHVVPWSRARLSQIENFVMTSRSVNSKKSDSLLAPTAMEQWLDHVDRGSEDLQDCAREHGWMADLDSVRRVAFHIYKAADANTGVWSFENGEHRVEPLGDDGKHEVLALLQ
ncbi:HNH endonuclease domain-containing protein [Candidatus Poriferisodalis sp.]|uniref:HNH endonuclease domain-containing protein n=1 Tax=Candidatus Poriferisodalis sp. TaxID=3101277 RepID=UPI003B51D6BB